MGQESLEELFEGAIDNRPPPQAATADPSAAAQSASAEAATDSTTGDAAEATADSSNGAPPATGTSDERMVPESALVGVRRDLQNKVSDLERQLNAVRAAQAQQSAPEPEAITEDDFEDPQKLVEKIETRFQQKFDAYRYSSSEEAARAQFSDYEEVMRSYQDVVNSSPGLAQEVDRAALPAVHAYQRVKAHLDAKQAGDPQVVEKRIESEVERRVAEAMEKVRADLGARLPSGLAASAGATGAATAEGVPWQGRTPLSKL